jgi:hypothetical protein
MTNSSFFLLSSLQGNSNYSPKRSPYFERLVPDARPVLMELPSGIPRLRHVSDEACQTRVNHLITNLPNIKSDITISHVMNSSIRTYLNRTLVCIPIQSWTPSSYCLSRTRTFKATLPNQRSFSNSAKSLKMKEAIVSKGPTVNIQEVPIPTPNADQVLIKVIYSGTNPKDWKRAEFGPAHNTGDDIAGYVEAVGENVTEFRKGDRVAAFHEMATPHGSFAEYAIAWAYTTFYIPKKTTFEEVSRLRFNSAYPLN